METRASIYVSKATYMNKKVIYLENLKNSCTRKKCQKFVCTFLSEVTFAFRLMCKINLSKKAVFHNWDGCPS